MKTKLKILTVIILLSLNFKIYSQDMVQGKLWVSVISDDALPANDSSSRSSILNSIFEQYGVYTYIQALPFAKHPELLKIHTILCTGDQHLLKQELEQNATDLLTKIREIPEPIMLFDPFDYFWQLQISNDTSIKKIGCGT